MRDGPCANALCMCVLCLIREIISKSVYVAHYNFTSASMLVVGLHQGNFVRLHFCFGPSSGADAN
jgi:hypothetical protein